MKEASIAKKYAGLLAEKGYTLLRMNGGRLRKKYPTYRLSLAGLEVVKGLPDYLLISAKEPVIFMEIKTENDRIRPIQHVVFSLLVHSGYQVLIAKAASVEQYTTRHALTKARMLYKGKK